jgi:hypothetical protein
MSQESVPENMVSGESQTVEHENVIDIKEDPFAYNREFDPTTIEGYRVLVGMRPSHIEKDDWKFNVQGIKLVLERAVTDGSTLEERKKIMEDFLKRNGLR